MENEIKTNESIKSKYHCMFLCSEKTLNYTSCIAPGQDAGRRRVGRDEVICFLQFCTGGHVG